MWIESGTLIPTVEFREKTADALDTSEEYLYTGQSKSLGIGLDEVANFAYTSLKSKDFADAFIEYANS